MPCQAIRYSDQMCCGKCGLAWDVNDPEPPVCPTLVHPAQPHQARRRHLEFIKRVFGIEGVRK